jgi:hypothetical protein
MAQALYAHMNNKRKKRFGGSEFEARLWAKTWRSN